MNGPADPLTALDSLAESFVHMAGALAFPSSDDLQHLATPSDSEDGEDGRSANKKRTSCTAIQNSEEVITVASISSPASLQSPPLQEHKLPPGLGPKFAVSTGINSNNKGSEKDPQLPSEGEDCSELDMFTLLQPIPFNKTHNWLPSSSSLPSIDLAQMHMVALAQCGVRHGPPDADHGLTVDESVVRSDSKTLARDRPESATLAIAVDPSYGSPSNLGAALELAHAHCLLHDLLDADARFDFDPTYAGLVSRFLAAITASPTAVTLVAEIDNGVRNLLGLQDMPSPTVHALTTAKSPALGPGFSLSLKSNAINVLGSGNVATSPKKAALQGMTLIPVMKARNLVWSHTQAALTESWYPWFFVEAGGLCGSVARGAVRLLANMRFGLGLYTHLRAAAEAANTAASESNIQPNAVYGLQTIGSVWEMFRMVDQGGTFNVSTIWTGNVNKPHDMAYALALLRSIHSQAETRLAFVHKLLDYVCGTGKDGRRVGARSPLAAPQPTPATRTSIPTSQAKGKVSPAPTGLPVRAHSQPNEPSTRPQADKSATRPLSPDEPSLRPWANTFKPLRLPKPVDDNEKPEKVKLKPVRVHGKSLTDLFPSSTPEPAQSAKASRPALAPALPTPTANSSSTPAPVRTIPRLAATPLPPLRPFDVSALHPNNNNLNYVPPSHNYSPNASGPNWAAAHENWHAAPANLVTNLLLPSPLSGTFVVSSTVMNVPRSHAPLQLPIQSRAGIEYWQLPSPARVKVAPPKECAK